MSDERVDVKILGVDRDVIAMGPTKENAWIIPFQLSLKPSQDWERNFYEAQSKNSSEMKRKSFIVGDCLKVHVCEQDDLQKILKEVQIEVAAANALCDGDYQKKMKIRHELEVLQARQGDVTRKFKEDADRLTF